MRRFISVANDGIPRHLREGLARRVEDASGATLSTTLGQDAETVCALSWNPPWRGKKRTNELVPPTRNSAIVVAPRGHPAVEPPYFMHAARQPPSRNPNTGGVGPSMGTCFVAGINPLLTLRGLRSVVVTSAMFSSAMAAQARSALVRAHRMHVTLPEFWARSRASNTASAAACHGSSGALGPNAGSVGNRSVPKCAVLVSPPMSHWSEKPTGR